MSDTTTPAPSLADVEAEHRADHSWGESICRVCGTAHPCQPLLAARGLPTVPCTACRLADEDGADVWAFPNRWVIHPDCAQALQPRDEAGQAAYRAVRDAARLAALDGYAHSEGVSELCAETLLRDVRSILRMP